MPGHKFKDKKETLSVLSHFLNTLNAMCLAYSRDSRSVWWHDSTNQKCAFQRSIRYVGNEITRNKKDKLKLF